MPFRGMGLGTFLLHMIQLQAASKNYSPEIYLQSNISSQAYHWYGHCGFSLTKSNALKELPQELRNWYEASQNAVISTPYVHFTTELCNSDVRQGGSDPLSEQWHAQQLLLMRLSKPIDLQGFIIDISIFTVESEEGKF